MVREETEVCTNCDCENVIKWDVERNGYKVYCQHCGAEMMLCDACWHSDDNPRKKCDWSGEGGCWRMEENRIKQIMEENNGWVPVSTGIFPEEGETVQISYLGFHDKEPYCLLFAVRREGKWLLHPDEYDAGLTVTAWKPICQPYVEPKEKVDITIRKAAFYEDSFMVTKEELESIKKGTLPDYIENELQKGIKNEEPDYDWEATNDNEVLKEFSISVF